MKANRIPWCLVLFFTVLLPAGAEEVMELKEEVVVPQEPLKEAQGKTQEQLLKEQDELLKEQEERIKKIEKLLVPTPEQLKEIEKRMQGEALKAQKERIDQFEKSFAPTPEQLKEIEKRMQEEALKAQKEQMTKKDSQLKLETVMEAEPFIQRQYYSCKSVSNKDINQCNLIFENKLAGECIDNFNFLYAFPQFLKDYSKNNKVTEQGLKNCKAVTGEIPGDSTAVCDAIGKSYLSGDTSNIEQYFAGLSGDDRAIAFASITGNKRYCKSVSAKNVAVDCYDYAAYFSALKDNDLAQCKNVDSDLKRKLCEVAISSEQNADACEVFADEQVSKLIKIDEQLSPSDKKKK